MKHGDIMAGERHLAAAKSAEVDVMAWARQQHRGENHEWT